MKNTAKGFVVGFVLSMLLTGTIAIAVNTSTLYDVITDGVKIIIDGKELHATDANGNHVEPMIYNGTTYLPVRAISNALNKAVYWDGPNFTVYLGEMDGELEYPTAYLNDLTSIASEVTHSYGKLTDNYGNSYSTFADNCRASKYELEYLTNMKYSRLKGTLYIPEGEKSNAEGFLQVIADGKIIYTSPKMSKRSRPVDVDVNIKGYNDIVIQFNTDSYNSLNLCFGDAGFYQ